MTDQELLEKAERASMRAEVYREQLKSVHDEPSTAWMDRRCRRYSLRRMASCLVEKDRAIVRAAAAMGDGE